ncbi:TACD2 protein, partial [Balaeniceps rex]|nr:TACD2 protein [Balaeniceps rex]
MEPLCGFLLGLILAVASSAQNNCTCATNKWTVCAQDASGNCTCTLMGSNYKVDCSTLTSKCLLMKAEIISLKEKHFWDHPCGPLDNDGIYNPDCEDSGIFKARQCNQANTCWCMNTVRLRRTEKGDKSLRCGELVRTSWIYIELKHQKRSSTFNVLDIANVLKHLFQSRYKLHPKYIGAIKYDSPLIQIHLNENDSEKSRCDVDIADVAYYFKKDIKNDSVFHSNSTLTVSVNGDTLDIEKIRIYYVDEKPPVFCINQPVAGISAVVTDCWPRHHCAGSSEVAMDKKYEKVENKEMGEIRAPSLQ